MIDDICYLTAQVINILVDKLNARAIDYSCFLEHVSLKQKYLKEQIAFIQKPEIKVAAVYALKKCEKTMGYTVIQDSIC
jgi:hypothetical protein